MNKYRKKPTEVEAIQLKEDNIKEVYTELYSEPILDCRMAEDRWLDFEDIVRREGMKLITPESGEGTQIASIGDFIVFGESEKLGRHCWPVKPDYFNENYDLIDEAG